ncbi:pyridoxamine 5'-phosphate oxidase, partial [Teratosphaeria destructans]
RRACPIVAVSGRGRVKRPDRRHSFSQSRSLLAVSRYQFEIFRPKKRNNITCTYSRPYSILKPAPVTMVETVTRPSTASSEPVVAGKLPDEVETCLQNARYLHLATCTDDFPHVSLMNYTYLPSHPYSTRHLPAGPLVIMTSNPSSKKTINLIQNPNVSLLVHDWVSSRPPNVSSTGDRDRSPANGRSSSLATMLMQLNSAAVSSISATINGEAMVLEPASEEAKWCKEQHLLNNSFDLEGSTQDASQMLSSSPSQQRSASDCSNSYIADDGVRVIVVRIRDGRISDFKGNIKDFVLAAPAAAASEERPLVNGVGSHSGT